MAGQMDMFGPSQGYDENVALAVPLQCPIEVFANETGGVTIRQDQTGWMGDTVIIAMADELAVRAVIAALQREIGGAS